MDSIASVTDAGIVELDTQPKARAHLFRGNWSDGRQLELWFADAEPPLLLQARFTTIVPPSAEGRPNFRLEQTTRFDWTTGKPIEPATFQPTLPSSSREVDDLFAVVTGAGATLQVGARAPELDLEILGGGRLRLADHIDLDVVVLNFWATWYPIGVESLPTLAEFARTYAPRGVAFYHINMAEAEADVEKYVNTLKFPMVVALDPKGRIMESYAVRVLPFSVVIGRDGTIRAVNAGDLRGFRDRFTQQLDEVLK
jgi:thiol-disulfide isomerase/thioredoxin